MAQPTQAQIATARARAGPFLDWAKPINVLPGVVTTNPRSFPITNANRALWVRVTGKATNVTGQGVNLTVPHGDSTPAEVNAFLTALDQGMAPNNVGPRVVNREVVANSDAGIHNLLGTTAGPDDYYHAGEAAALVESNRRGTFWLVATQESYNHETAYGMQDFNDRLANPLNTEAQHNQISQQKYTHYATASYIWHDVAVLVWKSKTYIYNPSFPSINNTYWNRTTGARHPHAQGGPRVSSYWLLGGVISLLQRLHAGGRVNVAVANGNIRVGGGGNDPPIDECRPMALIWIARVGAIVNQINILEAKGAAGRTPPENAELATLLAGFQALTRPNPTPNVNATPSTGLWTVLRRG